MKESILFKVENIVAKGEIACLAQFLLFQQCFQTSTNADASKCDYKWELNDIYLFIHLTLSEVDNAESKKLYIVSLNV